MKSVNGLDAGSTLHAAQEDIIRGRLTGLTGEEMEHYYIRVNVLGEEIPVDPMRVYN